MKDGNPVLGGGGIHHVTLNVKDFDASVAFYTQVLGCREALAWEEKGGRAVMLDTGDGSCVEMFSYTENHGGEEGAFLHLALRTSKCDEVLEKVRAAGMEVTMEPTNAVLNGKAVHVAFFKGPSGELVELFQG